MSIETKIKELEEQLELKKAFLSAKISFGPGNKFSEVTKNLVIETLKAAATSHASGEPIKQEEGITLTADEIAILKQFAAAIVAKTGAGTTAEPAPQVAPGEPTGMGSMVSKALKNIKDQTVRAQVATLDNVDRNLRAKIEPLSIVQVVGKMDNNTAFVRDEKGFQFHIPMDDLDFDYNK